MKNFFYFLVKILIWTIGIFLIIIIAFLIFSYFNGSYIAPYNSKVQNNILFHFENHTFLNDTKKGNYTLKISPNINNKNSIIKNFVIKTDTRQIIKKLDELKYPFRIKINNINYTTYLVTGEIIITGSAVNTDKSRLFKVIFKPAYKKPQFISTLDILLGG